MKTRNRQAMVAGLTGATILMLILTLLASFSAGTARGLQSSATPTPAIETTGGNNPVEAERLLSQAQGADLEGADPEVVALLALRSLQAGYSAEADLLLGRTLDRLAYLEQVYNPPSTTYVTGMDVSADGRYIMVGYDYPEVRIFDAQTGAVVQTLEREGGGILSVAFSPDGTLGAIGDNNRTALVWDVATGEVIHQWRQAGENIEQVAFSPDGGLLATTSSVGEAFVYDVTTGNLVRDLRVEGEQFHAVTFSPDGRLIFLGGQYSPVRLWDYAAGEFVHEYNAEEGYTASAQFTPDGQQVIFTMGYLGLRVWNVLTGEIENEITTTGMGRMQLSPDGRYAITDSDANRAFLWDTSTWEIVNMFSGHGQGIWAVAFAPDGQSIYTGAGDGTVRRWPIEQPAVPGSFGGHLLSLNAVEYSADGTLLLTGGDDGLVNIWDTATHALLQTITMPVGDSDSSPAVLTAGFMPDSHHLYTVDYINGFLLWDATTGELAQEFPIEIYDRPSVAISPDGQTAALTMYQNIIRLLDLTTGEITQLRQNNGTTLTVAYSADGTRLIAGGTDNRVRVWDLTTGRIIKVLGEYVEDAIGVGFTPDATQALVNLGDGSTIIVDIQSGRVLRSFDGSGYYYLITKPVFSADTVRVLVTEGQGVVRIIDVPSGDTVRVFSTFGNTLTSAAYSPDETHVLTGGTDGIARVFTVDLAAFLAEACTQLSRDFSEQERVAYEVGDGPTCPNLTPSTGEIDPTWTPYPTNTLPVWTPLPTLTASPTPSPSPTPLQFTVELGENHGELAIGEVQQWTYEGQAGQAINIRLIADAPANNTDDTTRATDSLLDTYLRVYTTYGVLLAEHDDINPGVDTNSEILALVPPYPGTIVIEVTSYEGMTGGGYTLVIEAVGEVEETSQAEPTFTATPS